MNRMMEWMNKWINRCVVVWNKWDEWMEQTNGWNEQMEWIKE